MTSLLLFALLIAQFNLIWSINECCYTPPCDDSRKICKTDFVVIGVGTAGALLSKRLTDPRDGTSFSVVGLEWGEYHNDDFEVNTVDNAEFLVPGTDPRFSNDLTILPDPGIFGVQPHVQYGRMLGGSGNHNFAYVVHPSPRLMNEDWVSVGGSEWSFDSIQEVMNSFETYHGNSTVTRGTNGPIQIQQVDADPNPESFGNIFFNTLDTTLPSPDANTSIVEDYNANWDTFINNKPQYYWKVEPNTILRSSTGLDYTNTSVVTSEGFGVNGRKLRIRFGALVDKILFDSNKKAYAVKYTVNGVTKYVFARKRIILTAYTVNSPVILQRSGYGNATLLESMGIEVVYDNPNVGLNLQNHVGSVYVVASNVSISTGFLTEHAYLSILPEVNGRRLVQLLLSPLLSSTGNAALDAVIGLTSLPEGWVPYAIYTAVMYPASRGWIQVTSLEPAVQPIIYSGIYSDPTNRDLRAVGRTFRNLYNNLLTIQSSYPDSFRQMYPPESAFQSGSDPDLYPYIQGLPFIHEHWAGTCSMGTVVDSNLNLIGVDGVTVADLSVAPVINDGNTCTMAMFVAQRAADILLDTFRDF